LNFKVDVYLRKKLLLEETKGFADRQIAHDGLFRKRSSYKRMDLNINPVFKLVDTCAADLKPKHLYYYSL
jgi:carbamoyl-phosphate synthase large subunit